MHHDNMPNLFMREALLRELRAQRIDVDRLAAYLLVMAQSNVPCPRCYAEDAETPLAIADVGDGTERGSCSRCAATIVWPAS